MSREVDEVREQGEWPLYGHPEWRTQFPWLRQGITAAGPSEHPFDLRLPAAEETESFRRQQDLGACLGFGSVVLARQVHGAEVRAHDGAAAGVLLVHDVDGHLTASSDILLCVSVADCVPVYLVDPGERAVALLHAGWRGCAAGVLENGLAALARLGGASWRRFKLHLGPSICGSCYEVGPEVHVALGLPVPASPKPVDLRAWLVKRAVAAGIPLESITTSGHCTCCGGGIFFSHRAGRPERQLAYLGIIP